jgi:hypothetical protein
MPSFISTALRGVLVVSLSAGVIAGPHLLVPRQDDPIINPCVVRRCPEGYYCEVVSPFGAACYPKDPTVGETCGERLCSFGMRCCKPECPCQPAGMLCLEEGCAISSSAQCGTRICPSGTKCCSPTCSLCTAPGEICPSIICARPP